MWSAIASRKHTPAKVFPFGSESKEFMLYGTVEFGFKNGGEGEVEWAARAEMSQQGRKWKMSFYQVYLVSNYSTTSRIDLLQHSHLLIKMPRTLEHVFTTRNK